MAYGTRKIKAPERPPRGRPALKQAIIKQEEKKASKGWRTRPRGFDPKAVDIGALGAKAKGLGARSLAKGAGKSFKRMPVASPHSIKGKRLSKRRK